MEIRDYKEGDAEEIVRLFHETVHSVNRPDYSREQVEAWAPEIPDAAEWHQRMAVGKTFVAEQAGEVVGFAELEENGHLDMLYVRSDLVGRGVGQSLYQAAENLARALNSGWSLPRQALRPERSSSGKAFALYASKQFGDGASG